MNLFSNLAYFLWTSCGCACGPLMETEQLNVLGTKAEQRARVGRPQTRRSPPVFAGRPKAAFLFSSLVVLDVVCGHLEFFLLDIK